jgi:hypothetical protein
MEMLRLLVKIVDEMGLSQGMGMKHGNSARHSTGGQKTGHREAVSSNHLVTELHVKILKSAVAMKHN